MPHYEVPEVLRGQAKRMRRDLTEAERRFWHAVRAHRLNGIAFRRQMPIAGYIADFAAPEYKLVVEIDGGQHGMAKGLSRDELRDGVMQDMGWTVLRFWNRDVLANLDAVLETVLANCNRENQNDQ